MISKSKFYLNYIVKTSLVLIVLFSISASSSKMEAVSTNENINRSVAIRRIGVNFANVIETENVQLSLFTDQEKIDKERKLELTMSSIKNKMGKNMILRGMNLEEGATTLVRNKLIGGHNSGE